MRTFTLFVLLATIAVPLVHVSSAQAAPNPNAITAVGTFPHGLGLSYDRTLESGKWSWGLTAAGIPTLNFNFNTGTAAVGLSSANARFRWHPYQGALFFGFILGSMTLSGSGTNPFDVAGTPVNASVSLDVVGSFLTPHAGWIWKWDNGFTLGLEAGYQLPTVAKTDLDVNITDPSYQHLLNQLKAEPLYQRFESDLEKALEGLGKIKIPYAMIRIGWSF